jgi:acetyl esterase/lipase
MIRLTQVLGVSTLALWLAGCRDSTHSADDVCSFEYQNDKTDEGRTIGTLIADDAGIYQIHVAVRWPATEGEPGTAPVAITLQGGWDHEGTPINSDTPRLDTTENVVDLHLDLPGAGESGGENDRRGPIAAAAVASVLRWAAGETVDAGGCHLADRAPMANPDDIYIIGASNGGNLAYSVLTDDTLNLPTIAGLITWETPTGAQFVNVELGKDPTVYTPGSCSWSDPDGIQCSFPSSQLTVGRIESGVSALCFDMDADQACSGSDIAVRGTEAKETGEVMLSPAMRQAVAEEGLTVQGYASLEDTDAWWSYRDAGRRVKLLTDMRPDLPILLIGSEEDHVLTTWTDHPHVHGIGEALQASGAFWTRLNPGTDWMPENQSPNTPNLPLSLAGDNATLLTEDQEEPLIRALTAAVQELSDRHARGDWTSD